MSYALLKVIEYKRKIRNEEPAGSKHWVKWDKSVARSVREWRQSNTLTLVK